MRAQLRELDGVRFDVAVIGAGVNGAAAAQHLAAAGFRTLLVEQNDFASGSSSRSSRPTPAPTPSSTRPARTSACTRHGISIDGRPALPSPEPREDAPWQNFTN